MPRYPKDPVKAVERAMEDINETGKVQSPMVKRMLSRGNMLSDEQREVRDEFVYLLWVTMGKDQHAVRKALGDAKKQLIERIIKSRVEQKEHLASLQYEQEVEIEKAYFRGRKTLIDRCFELAARAVERGIDQIPEMKGKDAIVSAGVMIDKGLLMSGQPTSRVAKTDERMMGNEELEAKAKEMQKRLIKLHVPDGEGKQGAA